MPFTHEALLYGWAFSATAMAITCAIGWYITWKALKRLQRRRVARTVAHRLHDHADVVDLARSAHPQWVSLCVVRGDDK